MLATFAVIVVFSFVILIHELGHFLIARRTGIRVEKFSIGFGKTLFCKKIGDTEYSISIIPFGGYVKMAGDEPTDKAKLEPWEFYAKAPGRRFWVIFAGAALNYIFAFLIFCFIIPSTRVDAVLEGSPAFKAGLKQNDRVVAIDNKKVNFSQEIVDVVSNDIDRRPLRFKIERDGKIIEKDITPVILKKDTADTKQPQQPQIGLAFSRGIEYIKAGPLEHISLGAYQTAEYTKMTYSLIGKLITGKARLKTSAAGPVMIAVMIGNAAKAGMVYLLFLLAHINLAIAVFNLLPFPVLDGGHILFLGLEKIRGKVLSVKTQEIIQYAAITLLIGLALFITYNDLTTIWSRK